MRLLPIVVLAGLAGTLAGQEPPQFPVQSELVVLDLIVRDDQDRALTDLRTDEIEVFEDGLPCAVQSIRLVQAEGPADRSSAPSSSPPNSTRTGPGSAPATGPSDTPLRPNLVILVFDRLGATGLGPARQAALDFARRAFAPRTWFAVYEVGNAVRVRQPFTDDPALLAAAIEESTTRVGDTRDPGSNPDYATLTKQALAKSLIALGDATGVDAVDPVLAQNIRAPKNQADTAAARAEASMDRLADALSRQRLGNGSLHARLAIARELQGLEGRKTLLLFSEGLHVPSGLTDLVDTAVSEANRGNLAVYALDPRGLLTEGHTDETQLALLTARGYSQKIQQRQDPETQARTGTSSPELSQSVPRTEIHAPEIAEDALRLDTQANLRDLAEATGGFLVANTNDLGAGIERIGADLRSYYEIAYVPPNPVADGTFRAIEVRVSRPRGHVRTRRGYFARAADAPAPVQPWELLLAEAFELEAPPHDFAYRVEIDVVPGDAERREVRLSLVQPLRGLQFDYDRGERTYRAHFSVLAVVRDREGNVVTRLSHDWPITGPLVKAPEVRNQAATVRRALELAPGEYVLESAVGDRLGGSLSVERTPFSVGAGGAGDGP